MTRRDRMPCSGCKGHGTVPLPNELQATLTALRKGAATAPLLSRRMRIEHTTAMNNKLETLRQLGHAIRERAGKKEWLYMAVRDAEGRLALPMYDRYGSPVCRASRGDGECNWKDCPQIQDGEPEKTGRYCPLDVQEEGDEA